MHRVTTHRRWPLRTTGSHVSEERLPELYRDLIVGLALHQLQRAGGGIDVAITTKEALRQCSVHPCAADELDVALSWPSLLVPLVAVERLVRRKLLPPPQALSVFVRTRTVSASSGSWVYGVEHKPNRAPVLVLMGIALLGPDYVLPISVEPLVSSTRWDAKRGEPPPAGIERVLKDLPYEVPVDIEAHVEVLLERIELARQAITGTDAEKPVALPERIPLMGGRIDYGGPSRRGGGALTSKAVWLGDRTSTHLMLDDRYPTLLSGLACIDLSRSSSRIDAADVALIVYRRSDDRTVPGLLFAEQLRDGVLTDIVDISPDRLPPSVNPAEARYQLTRGHVQLYDRSGDSVERRAVIRRSVRGQVDLWLVSGEPTRLTLALAELYHSADAADPVRSLCIDRYIDDFAMPFRLQPTSTRVRAAMTAASLTSNMLLVAAGRA